MIMYVASWTCQRLGLLRGLSPQPAAPAPRIWRCWNNAVIERLFLNLKMERVWQNDYANHAKATNDIADYIVSFYNTVRLHSALGNLPHNAFEHQASSGNHITYRRVQNNLTRTYVGVD